MPIKRRRRRSRVGWGPLSWPEVGSECWQSNSTVRCCCSLNSGWAASQPDQPLHHRSSLFSRIAIQSVSGGISASLSSDWHLPLCPNSHLMLVTFHFQIDISRYLPFQYSEADKRDFCANYFHCAKQNICNIFTAEVTLKLTRGESVTGRKVKVRVLEFGYIEFFFRRRFYESVVESQLPGVGAWKWGWEREEWGVDQSLVGRDWAAGWGLRIEEQEEEEEEEEDERAEGPGRPVAVRHLRWLHTKTDVAPWWIACIGMDLWMGWSDFERHFIRAQTWKDARFCGYSSEL